MKTVVTVMMTAFEKYLAHSSKNETAAVATKATTNQPPPTAVVY